MENYIGDNWFILAIVLLIATIFIPILLFVLLFIKSGKFVKKPVGFGIVQAYSVIACVLMLIVRSERVNFAGVILGFLTIFVTVGTAFVKKYDFWGYCDLDLIFGDIRKFVNEEVLNTYEKIYNRGHLTLFKNSLNSFLLTSLFNIFIYDNP